MKILNIIGARPQIIKSAAISRAIRTHYLGKIQEIIVHTGQHYDHNMSEVFFEEMQIPQPHYNLGVGSGSHGKQTAAMIEGIEKIIIDEKPNCIVVYGDTNSTLAASIAASKMHCPIAHIEAGLRSFNKKMPEEINRIMCDHSSSLLFAPTKTAIDNLVKEGFKTDNIAPFSNDNPGVYHCGDIMYDNSIFYAKIAKEQSKILQTLGIADKKFILATIHRDNNTDIPERFAAIFNSLLNIASNYEMDIILPLHPRAKKLMSKNLPHDILDAVNQNKRIKIIEPLSFLDITALESNAFLIMTDSGGLQKESYFFKKPCIILRPETEWIELVETGAAILADANQDKILGAFEHYYNNNNITFHNFYGDGNAAQFICSMIFEHFYKSEL